MFTLRMSEQTERPGVKIEIWNEDRFMGVIYPTEKGIKVVSKDIMDNPEAAIEIDRSGLTPIPAILINLIYERRRTIKEDVEKLIQEICNKYGISKEDITGPKRTRLIAEARNEAYIRLRDEFHLSWLEIAKIMGRKSHTTPIRVIRAKKRSMQAPSET